MKRLFVLLFSGILLKSFASEPFVFKHFDIGNGLPSTQVYQIVQDSEGYIWLATDRGVSRYDGYRFKNFTRKDGLTDEVVFGFYPEENGRIWFYTYNGGLCYYEKGNITEPDFNAKFKGILRDLGYPVIVSLFVDEKGNIWVGSEFEHIFKISRDGHIQTLFTDRSKYSRSKLVEIKSSRKSNLVYTGARGGFFSSKVSFLSLPDSLSYSVSLDSNVRNATSCKRAKILRIDQNTFIYLYSSSIFKIVNGKVEQYLSLEKDYCTLYALHMDRDNNLWIGTWKGVFCFPDADLSVKPKLFLTSQPVSSVWQDHEGGYWFSSLENGAFYIPHFKIRSVPKSLMGSNKVVEIAANSYGVYAASMSMDLIIFPQGYHTNMKILPDACSYGETASLNKWGDYVMAYNGGDNRNFFKDSVLLKRSPFVYFTNSYRNDDQSDFLWSSFKKNTFTLISERSDSIVASFKFDQRRIRCATATKDLSKIWIGLSSGLYVYENGKVIDVGERISQFSGRISDLDVIDNRYLLVTTRGNGVLRYDYQKQVLTKLEGVPNEYCNQSYVDDQGIIWVASFSGVTRINHVTANHPAYRHFSTHSGLTSNEVYSIAEFKDHIWIATGEGVNWWHRNWYPDEKSTSATINRFLVNNEEYDPQSVPKLSARQNHLQFFFSAICFHKPMEYFYRLKGLHSNWIGTMDPGATYSALKPGHYTFELKSAGRETILSSIPFTINPPFWYNPWFLGSVATVLTLGLISMLRIRYRIILKEDKLYNLFLKAEQKALRAQINPHFLFNTFNSILELLVHKKYQSAQTYMKRFSKLMRMVLKYSRKEEILLVDELKLLELYLQLEKLRFGSTVQFRIETAPNLQPNTILLPSMLLQPYVENAIKHGIRSRHDGKGFLNISFSLTEDQLRMRIEDNGKGYKNTAERPGKRNAYGMKINGDRIALFNKKDHLDMRIFSLFPDNKEYPGTVIELYLPFKTIPRYETMFIQNPDH